MMLNLSFNVLLNDDCWIFYAENKGKQHFVTQTKVSVT